MVISPKMVPFGEEIVLWGAGSANTNETNRFHRCFEVLPGAKVGVFVEFT